LLSNDFSINCFIELYKILSFCVAVESFPPLKFACPPPHFKSSYGTDVTDYFSHTRIHLELSSSMRCTQCTYFCSLSCSLSCVASTAVRLRVALLWFSGDPCKIHPCFSNYLQMMSKTVATLTFVFVGWWQVTHRCNGVCETATRKDAHDFTEMTDLVQPNRSVTITT